MCLCRSKHLLKRRLRIRTLQFGTARNMNELYDNVDCEVVLSILVHKVSSHFLYNDNLLEVQKTSVYDSAGVFTLVIIITRNKIKKTVINMNQNNQTINRAYTGEMLISYIIHPILSLVVVLLYTAYFLKELLASNLRNYGNPPSLFSLIPCMSMICPVLLH